MIIHSQSTGKSVSARRFVNRNSPNARSAIEPKISSLKRCVRATICPARVALTISETTSGSNASPDSVAARVGDRLEPARQEDHRAEEAERGEEHRRDRDRERPIAEQLEVDDRVRGPRLPPHEHDTDDQPSEHQPADPRVGPAAVCLFVRPTRNGPMAAANSAAPT